VVNGTHLVGNPTTLPHVCQAWRSAKEKVDRMFYKKCQDIPKDRNFANIKPIQVYQGVAHEVFSCDVADEAERNDLLRYFSRDQGYKQRKSALWRKLGEILGSKYPPMADLILALQECAITARGILLNFERRRQPRTLRRRDRRRRDRIEKEMARFKALWDRHRGFLRTGTINTYCRRMSRYVSEKVI
ncbi:hypothetical protein GCK32_017095, partial [Trichostrongylus colubriformis]